MTDAVAAKTKSTRSETLKNCALLAEVICRSIEAAIKAPPVISAPDRALPLYRDMAARHRAGAVGVLLSEAKRPSLKVMGANLKRLSGDSPLASVAFSNAEPAAKAAAAEIIEARQRLIDDLREHPDGVNPRRILLDGTNLLQLGDIDGAKAKLAALAGAEAKLRMTLRMRIMDAEGFIADAERLAIQIRRTYPDMLPPYTGIAADYRRVGSVALSPPAADDLTPASMNAYLRYLILNDKQVEAAAYAAEHADLIPQQFVLVSRAAAVVLANEGHRSELWRLVREAAEKLPITSKAGFLSIAAEITPKRLAGLLEEAVAVAEDTTCTLWLSLIERCYAMAEPVPSGTPSAEASLNALLAITDLRGGAARQALAEYAAETGYVVADESADPNIFRSRALANAPLDRLPTIPRQTLTDRSVQFLEEAKQSGRGIVLLSAHGVRLGRGNYLPAAAAALAGFSVKTVIAFDGVEFEQRFNSYIETLTSAGGAIEIVNRKGGEVAAETLAMLEHLNTGGAIDIAPDGIYTIGQKVAAPWLLRPMPMSIYATQLAIARNAAAAFASVAPGPEGKLTVDLRPISLPPPKGAVPVRAAWLTQRLARTIRQTLRESAIPVSATALVEGGGRPGQRDLQPLPAWGENAIVRDSLCGWLAAPPADAGAFAFSDPNGDIQFRDLQNYALSTAEMLLHFQSEKAAHNSPKRRFLQQHRVLAILPNGVAALAIGLGALAAGSLLAVGGDDLAPDALAERVQAFKPDLIIAGAAKWTEVLAANARLNRFSVLLIDDAGDAAAIEDLTQSFEPAQALPPMTAGQPALAVFTSGSDGAPKCVVSANTLHSNGAGLDKLLPLKQGDRVVYLTRWDAIGLADILACLRGGASIAAPAEGLTRAPDAFVAWLNAAAPSVLSMPSSLWAGLSETPAWRDAPPPLRAAILWGERIERRTVRRLAETLPNAGVYTTFGASEASYMGFGRLDPDAEEAPFSPGGMPVPGVDLKFVPVAQNAPISGASSGNDEQESGEDEGETSEPILEVTGADVMLGYFADLSDANAILPESRTRTVQHQDRVSLSPEGAIEVYGRQDSIVKLLGRRVSLMEAQVAAEAVPGVRRALAFVMKDGARDRIMLALESDTADAAALKLAVANAVSDAIFAGARPARIAVLPVFPAGPTGKLNRSKIRFAIDTEGDTAAAPETDASPRPAQAAPAQTFLDALERWAIYNGMASEGRFNPDARPPELDSIDIMDLILLAEDETGATQSTAGIGLDGPPSWRALATALAPGG